MVIFHSYVSLLEGNYFDREHFGKSWNTINFVRYFFFLPQTYPNKTLNPAHPTIPWSRKTLLTWADIKLLFFVFSVANEGLGTLYEHIGIHTHIHIYKYKYIYIYIYGVYIYIKQNIVIYIWYTYTHTNIYMYDMMYMYIYILNAYCVYRHMLWINCVCNTCV